MTNAELSAKVDKLTELVLAMAEQKNKPAPKAKAKAKAKAAPKEPEELTGPFAEMNKAKIKSYLITVFKERNKESGIWFFSQSVGRKKAIWSMAHHLSYIPTYTFSDKAAGYAQAILALDKRNDKVLDALRVAKVF